jgi:flagellar hook-associated protein 2
MITSIANSLGFGSGIDTTKLVDDLANASRAPKLQRLDGLERNVKAKISALAQARSDLDSFATSLASVASQDSLRTQPSVSDSSIIEAAGIAGARLGGLSAELTVSRLAKAQTSVSQAFADAETSFGMGGLTLSVNGQNFNITIDASNSSLNGIAAAINQTGSGVKASIVRDNGSYRLVLKGETGSSKAFGLTANGGSDPLLSTIVTTAMSTGQSAQDAQFSVDGVTFSRPTNTVDDVIPGVIFTLRAERPGTPVSLGAVRPTETLRQTLNDFISVFNELKTNLSDARTAASGAASIRVVEQKLGTLVSKAVTSHPTINSLSDIGVGTNRDGTITIDMAKFAAAVASDPDAVEAIFSPTRDANHTAASDPGISGAMSEIKESAIGSAGPLDSLRRRFEKEAQAIDIDREKIEVREAAYRLRLEAQYSAMDARIGALNATRAYLDQQIKLWTNDRA